MEKFTIIAIIGIIFLALLVWGLIGSSQVSKIGNTCDIGINNHGSVFCWKWHRNIIGDFQDNVNDFFDREK